MNTVTIKEGNMNFTDSQWKSFDIIYLGSADEFFSFISSDCMNKIRTDAQVVFEN